jgi:hypothetical protein
MVGIQVREIQEEYQKYMEQVRNKAQAAINDVNQLYEHKRLLISGEIDKLVRQLDVNFFNVLGGPIGPQEAVVTAPCVHHGPHPLCCP